MSNKQQVNVPEADYVSMENGAPRSAYAYYVVPVEPRKRRQCGGCCCFLCLATFLLCFFLIPRTPTVWLKNLTYTVSDDDSVVVGTFAFENNDFYKVEWSDADIEMYWVPIDGDKVVAECSCSGLYYGSMCARQVGSFKKDATFSTEARSTSEQAYEMQDKSSQEQACWANMIRNTVSKSQPLVARGHVKNKAQGKVKVTDSYYWLG